jgi:hypothetical protein
VRKGKNANTQMIQKVKGGLTMAAKKKCKKLSGKKKAPKKK